MSNSDDEVEYIISISEEGPLFLKRDSSFVAEAYEPGGTLLDESEIAGWNSGNMYKYRSAGLLPVQNAPWASYIKCRDNALGANDCDIQFIPLDIKKLMEIYDDLLWKIDEKTLAKFLE